MNRLLLVYHSANAAAAQQLAGQLKGHAASIALATLDQPTAVSPADTVAQNPGLRVLLLVSDNLLKNEQAVTFAMDLVQQLSSSTHLLSVVANGQYVNDSGEIQQIKTSYERVSNIIHYMNYWQEHYLELRRKANSDGVNTESVNNHLRIVRFIYQNISEMFRSLRDRDYWPLNDVEAQAYQPILRWLDAAQAPLELEHAVPQQAAYVQHIEASGMPHATSNTNGLLQGNYEEQEEEEEETTITSFDDLAAAPVVEAAVPDPIFPVLEAPAPITKFVSAETLTAPVINIEDLLNGKATASSFLQVEPDIQTSLEEIVLPELKEEIQLQPEPELTALPEADVATETSVFEAPAVKTETPEEIFYSEPAKEEDPLPLIEDTPTFETNYIPGNDPELDFMLGNAPIITTEVASEIDAEIGAETLETSVPEPVIDVLPVETEAPPVPLQTTEIPDLETVPLVTETASLPLETLEAPAVDLVQEATGTADIVVASPIATHSTVTLGDTPDIFISEVQPAKSIRTTKRIIYTGLPSNIKPASPQPIPPTAPAPIAPPVATPLAPTTETGQPEGDTMASIQPQLPEERLHYAIYLIDAGYNDVAVESLVALIADCPTMTVARLTLAGFQAENLKQYDAACKTLETLLQQEPGNEDALYLIGQYCLQLAEVWRSRMFWERLADINPEYPKVHELIGNLILQHYPGQFKQAGKSYKKALRVDPENATIRHKYAELLYLHLSKYDKAADEWSKLLNANPDDAVARLGLQKLKLLGIIVEIPPTTAEVEQQNQLAALAAAKIAFEAEQAKIYIPTNDNGLVVLITGATSGIGRATAEVFAAAGYRTLITGRREDRLEETAEALKASFGNHVATLPFDVRSKDAVAASFLELPEAFAEIDILINNAGLAKGLAPIHEGSLDHWDTMIDTNLKGLLYITRQVAPSMVARKRGHIINIGSTAGKEVYPMGNVYCATKFAVDALSRAMRQDLYTHNIRVSQISPGHVEQTEFALVRFDGDTERSDIYRDFKPLSATDVARVIYFAATQPEHVNIQDIVLMSTQQASAMLIHKNGRSDTDY